MPSIIAAIIASAPSPRAGVSPPPKAPPIAPITFAINLSAPGMRIRSPMVVSAVTRTGSGFAPVSSTFAVRRISREDAPMRISYAPSSAYQS